MKWYKLSDDKAHIDGTLETHRVIRRVNRGTCQAHSTFSKAK